ncbi:MAG: sodium:calcium antiporter, partial [Candidatus Kapaibacterium sp.]
MEVVLAFLWLIMGSAGLYFGAEGLVSGSASVAIKAGIKVLVVGLTIVAFGTSSPELVISLSAALEGKGDISAGNIIGSNICNIALILGAAALIRPIEVNKKIIRS